MRDAAAVPQVPLQPALASTTPSRCNALLPTGYRCTRSNRMKQGRACCYRNVQAGPLPFSLSPSLSPPPAAHSASHRLASSCRAGSRQLALSNSMLASNAAAFNHAWGHTACCWWHGLARARAPLPPPHAAPRPVGAGERAHLHPKLGLVVCKQLVQRCHIFGMVVVHPAQGEGRRESRCMAWVQGKGHRGVLEV